MSACGRLANGLASALLLLGAAPLRAQVGVAPTVETTPVPTSGDAADDASIWIHPSDPSLSTIIGTDKRGGGLAVYNLAGQQLQYDSSVEPNNVDIRYNFPLGGGKVALVGFSNEDGDLIGVFTVDPATRLVQNVQARNLKPTIKTYGFCLYRSPLSGKYYAFVTNSGGSVEQWELFDNGAGKVDGARVRNFTVGSQSEGCVADDSYGALYVAEEDVGIWKYGAEPGDGSARTLVDSVSGPHLEDDVEGLTIYYTSSGMGYLIASSQGSSTFEVYERTGINAHVMSFEIVAGNGIDNARGTDGIDVSNFSLGPSFPEGVFVAQDGGNTGGNQNFKLVPWGAIARALSPNLAIDTSWDPRQVGGSGGGGSNQAPVVNAGPDGSILLAGSAVLDGTVTDDGQPPPGPLTAAWSQDSGPGTASFADSAAVDTTATFSAAGTYVLRLTASDGELSSSDTVTVVVSQPGTTFTVEVRVGAGSDDAEEKSSGNVDLASSDLELVYDGSSQTVGMRFASLNVPRNATIAAAWVQFKVDETSTTSAPLTLRGQAADNAAAFTTATRNVSSRPRTAAQVAWSPSGWTTVGAAGPAQRTPDLAPLVQEIVNRTGWTAGNALALIVTGTGTGKRVGEAYEGDRPGAPLLHVEYK